MTNAAGGRLHTYSSTHSCMHRVYLYEPPPPPAPPSIQYRQLTGVGDGNGGGGEVILHFSVYHWPALSYIVSPGERIWSSVSIIGKWRLNGSCRGGRGKGRGKKRQHVRVDRVSQRMSKPWRGWREDTCRVRKPQSLIRGAVCLDDEKK